MLPTTFATPSRLAIFVLEQGSGLPIARMPAYAEVVVRSEGAEPPVDPFQGLDDPIQAALRADAPENLGDPEPRRRLLDAINRELVRQLGSKGLGKLSEVPGALPKFVAAVIQRIRGAASNMPLRSIDGDDLALALKRAIREEATKQNLPLEPPFVGAPTVWAYSLGVLATDHVGYLSYDLSRLPLTVRKALSAAVKARSLDPAATLDVTVAVFPTGPGGAFFDALAQGRVTREAIVSRFEVARLDLPDAIQNLALPAMQSPSLEDWRLSPGSFATNPSSLVGADGCESILPANLSLHEQYFYQVVRLRDVSVPVAPTVAQQVQLGIVNEYRVAWNPLGHSLGQIIYSMPLAPGESVNLAVIDWTRRDEAQRKERTTVDEQLVHNEHRDRTISEAVTAAAREYQHGSNFSAGVAGALGSTSGGTGAGIAGSLGGSTSSSSGSRDISGNTIQKLSDNITQVSSSMRELQSTVVVHSTQSERQAIETRTIVNYNHSHALTILYYEVLRHFRVVTEFVRQRPAVFVRFKTDWFDDLNGALHSIIDKQTVLAGALLDTRLAGAFNAVQRVAEGRYRDLSKPFPNQPPVTVDPNPPPRFHFFTFEMRAGGFTRNVDDDDQHADVLAHLLLTDGSTLTLLGGSGKEVLNHSGAFRMNGQNNVFTAVPFGNGDISWQKIRGINVHMAVFPSDEDDARVSISHIKITAFDLAGPPGIVIVDENHDDGHIVIRNQNSEADNLLTLPVKRPGPPAGEPPIVTGNEGADRAQALELIAHLKSNKRHYSRAIAISVGALERADALDAIAMSDGSTVLDHIENRPLEIVGDFLAYPSTDRDWNRVIAAKIANALDGEPDSVPLDERLVALPTRGVFAEAKLGHCNASELIDNTRFWDWQQSPIPHFAPEIAPTVPVTPQPQQQNLSTTPLPSSIVNIVNPPPAPDPTGLAAAFNVLGTANLFRDMSGTALTTDMLKNLADNAVKIAAVAGGSRAGQSGSSSGGGAGNGSRSSGGGGVGGPRAMPNQPSATNRDLHDLGNVLGRAQADNLITPAAAQSLYTQAAQDAVGGPMVAFKLDDADGDGGGVAPLLSPDPVHADEVGQTLLTYQHGKFAIFVPQTVLFDFQDEMTDVKVHLFFTAGQSALHDLLVHGVRGSSNDSDWVTIAIPGKRNDSVTISDAEIVDCLRAADIHGKPTALRLTGHSRGCDSLMATLATKKTVKNLSLIERVTFLDEAVEHFDNGPNKGAVRLNRVTNLKAFFALNKTLNVKLVAYEVGNRSVNTVTGVSAKDPDATYFDLPQDCMGAVGLVRLIRDGAAMKPAVATALDALPDLKALVDALVLPPRGDFTTKDAVGKTSILDFCQANTAQVKGIFAGLTNLNKSVLNFTVRHNLSGYGSNFGWGIACHHFFVAEVAHEFVD